MLTDDAKSSMYPFLLNLLNSGDITSLKDALPATTTFFATQGGLKSAMNAPAPATKNQIGVVSIHHPIFKYDQACGPKGTQSIMALMEEWKMNDDILGVIHDYNTGGGQASGNAEFAEYVHNYPKPVVSFTKDILGSAAYYMASASDYIIAHKYADLIGSIGSMFYKVNMEGVIKKQGGEVYEIYADPSTDKNSYSRALKAGDERPLIESVINPLANQFISDVKKYRTGVSEEALKGGVFNPEKAKELKLIDAIGTFQDAIDKVFELSQVNNQISNTSTMSKNREELQAVLGLDGPLAATEEHGSYLNEDQLDAVENRLTEQATAVANAQTEAQTAKDDLATEQTASTEVANKVNALAALANAETGETVADTLANLENRINEMNAKPGDSHTTAKKKENEEEASHPYMDFDTPFYNKAKSLLN